VSLYPELQTALVDAARRRYAPRRRALRIVRATVPVTVAVAAAAAGVWVAASGTPDGEQAVPPAATVQPTDLLSRTYEPFRRPATPADKLPFMPDFSGAPANAITPDVKRARLLIERGDRRVFAVAASRTERSGERPGVCLFAFRGDRHENAACTDIGDPRSTVLHLPVRDEDSPGDAIAAMAADGVDELVVRLPDGSKERRAFVDHAAYIRLDQWPTGLEWTDPGGERRSVAITPEERPFDGTP
jgi:hypothetical protein